MNTGIRNLIARGVLLVMVSIVGPHVAGAESKWILVDSDRRVSDFYYDLSSVVMSPESVVTVWTRAIYSEQGKAEAVKLIGSLTPAERLSHTHFLYDLDCQDETSLLRKVVHYDVAGEKLKEYDLEGKTERVDLVPSTRLDLLWEAVCPK